MAVALAVVFAGIGFVEYDRKQLFLNPKVVAADQYGNYFRVNSLFFDPNIYGRFLALVMIGVTTVVLWSVRRREVLLGGAVLLWLLAGLVTSFSQSSIAALLLGLAVLAAYRWDVRGTIYVTVALAAIALVVVAVAPASLHLGLTGKGGSASNATSGRTKLVEGGLRLFADRPLQGFGPGSFAQEYRAHEHVDQHERDLGLAHDPDHGRGRAGDRGPGAVRGAARVRLRGAVPRGRPLAAEDRAGGVLRGAGAAHLHLRRLPRGPGDVGAAGDRRGAWPARRAACGVAAPSARPRVEPAALTS